MLNIVICDDIKEHATAVEKILLLHNINEPFRTFVYTDIEELLYEIKETSFIFDIAILDVEMGQYNGIEIANEMLNIIPLCQIIFISGYNTYFEDAYLVDHVAFVTKPIKRLYFESALKKAVNKLLTLKSSSIIITSDRAKVVINTSTVMYLEHRKRITNVHLADGRSYTTYEALDALLAKINDDKYLRCHESFAVNTSFISEIRANTLMLRNGETIPISRKYKNNVENVVFITNMK